MNNKMWSDFKKRIRDFNNLFVTQFQAKACDRAPDHQAAIGFGYLAMHTRYKA